MAARSRRQLARAGAALLTPTTIVAGSLFLAACNEPAVTEAPTPTGVATIRAAGASAANQSEIPLVQFGINEHGSPFAPAAGHDQFAIDPFHRVNVYRPGTAPSDIDTSKLINFVSGPVFIPNFVIDDPSGRIAQSPPFQFAIDQTWTTPIGTFNTPGRYLVICNFLPHFVDNDMYGWVIVK